ncbi:ABC transporter ATP-binding protein [Pradoshia sp.]
MTLKIHEITKQFGRFTAVNQLSMEIEKGSIFGMLGANGAGKTTTFRMILGLIEPTAGKITWDGKSIDYTNSAQVGYLPEERGLYPKLKTGEQLIYLARLRGMDKADAEKEAKEWLERFNVPDYWDKKVGDLSKGNQQKIQFIASVIHKPELLILDEPFSGLDPVNVELLKNAVHDLRKEGTTIVFSSHRMEHVEELCENLCILQHGEAIVKGKLKEIKRSFGKKNVVIHADYDLSFLKDYPGVLKLKEVTEGVHLQISKEEDARLILEDTVKHGFIRKFELEEPSLQDIFIEKVGARYE